MIRTIVAVSLISLFSVTGAYAQGQSSNANGQPFEDLRQQIDAMQSQIDALSALVGVDPVEFHVDCSAGETINDALALAGDSPASIIITVSGSCNETVLILRSNVSLVGEGPGAGINGFYALLASRGANHVEVESMTLQGARAGLACWNGASVTARNVNIVNSSTGVTAMYGGNCDISNSLVDNNRNGLVAGVNSQIWLRGVNVTNSSEGGANVYTSGSISLEAGSGPTIFSNNSYGLQLFNNGSALIVQAIIENNRGHGISMSTGSALHFGSGSNVEIRDNLDSGILIGGSSNAILRSGVSISNNGGFGLECYGIHDVAFGNEPTYSGNTSGAIGPNCGL